MPFTAPLIEVDDDDEDVGRVLFTGSPSFEVPIVTKSGLYWFNDRYRKGTRSSLKDCVVELAVDHEYFLTPTSCAYLS